MTISLQSIYIKHEQRVRLIFTAPLGMGAFDASLYTITNLDGKGPNPIVTAALIVPNSNATVELALAPGLVSGAQYEVSCPNVPSAALDTTPDPTVLDFRYGLTTPRNNIEPLKDLRAALLYGTDIIWNDVDYQETAANDLDTVTGTANVTKALNRAIETDQLPWDSAWGVGGREYVDSPSPSAGSLKGNLIRQMLKDPRVKKVKTTVTTAGPETFITVTPTLDSGEPLNPVSMAIPNV